MAQNNAFTVAKRTLEGQDMIYQSLKLSNGIWALVGKRTVTYIGTAANFHPVYAWEFMKFLHVENLTNMPLVVKMLLQNKNSNRTFLK